MTNLSRRQAATAIGAGLALSACATTGAVRDPQVLINLADLADPNASADQTLEQVAASRDRAHRVTAPVMINGRGPFEFVVDTGANRTVVATELAAELGLPPAGRAEVHGIAGVEPSAMALIERLDVGRVDTRRLLAPTLGRERLGADGLLGVDVLRNRRLAIDFRRNTITIFRANAGTVGLSLGVKDTRVARSGRAPDGSDYTVVPARMRFGQLIVVDADLGGVPVVAFLDSGSQNTVGNLQLYRRLKARPELLSPRPLEVELISATGQTARGELSTVPTLRLGGLGIADLAAVFADLHIFKLWDLDDRPAILIGIDVMRHFEGIELDYGNRRVILRTPAGALHRAK